MTNLRKILFYIEILNIAKQKSFSKKREILIFGSENLQKIKKMKMPRSLGEKWKEKF